MRRIIYWFSGICPHKWRTFGMGEMQSTGVLTRFQICDVCDRTRKKAAQ